MTRIWEEKVVTERAGRAAELIIVLAILAFIAFVAGNLFSFSLQGRHTSPPPPSEARFETLDGVESGFIGLSRVKPALFKGQVLPPSLPPFTENLAQGGWASKPTKNGALERARPPTFTVTAYCGKSCCCGEFADGITASGHIIQPGDRFVAAPPDIPFGTLYAIEGYAGGRMVSVEDRGGKIRGNRLDVFFPDHDEALKWGVREFEVER